MSPGSDRDSRGRRPHTLGHSNLQVGSASSGHRPQSTGGSRHLFFQCLPPPGSPDPPVFTRSPWFLPRSLCPIPKSHLASRCKKRSARGLGSQHGVGRVQMHRHWSRHNQVPRSLGGWAEAGLGIPKVWSQAIPPADRASKA